MLLLSPERHYYTVPATPRVNEDQDFVCLNLSCKKGEFYLTLLPTGYKYAMCALHHFVVCVVYNLFNMQCIFVPLKQICEKY